MLSDNLAILFERDILKLKTEISAYTEEAALWSVAGKVSNSGGNLCLHLLGNLQYYIGKVLGNSGYTRDRPAEFSRKDVPVADLLQEIDHTKEVVGSVIRSLSAERLDGAYPEKVFDYPMTTGYFLLHLLAHLSYHTGQVNYHRRLLNVTG